MIETVPSGTVLHGKYRIERVLGSGGFGHVYLATDLATSQPCAVKEYLVTGSSGQEQLKHEAAVLSRLHHPNLPAFIDSFMEDGRYYIVLNYIEGRDLTDHVRIARQRNEVIPLSQIMQWILSICDAVMFLHSQHPSVIHRDIKPDNIRITPNGTAVLVDLGNAKAAADGARTLFFIRHQGTPGYAPPEQYPGGSGTDTRSDVYALGSTLYFALVAHEPPSVSVRNQSIQLRQPDLPSLQDRLAKNPPATPPEANELRQFRLGVTKPPKPSPRHSKHLAQLGTLPPGLLDRLNSIVQRAMAMRPQERYQLVKDFANELRTVMAALPRTPQPSAQPIDPHSTQPDLQGAYDALQAAKAAQEQDARPAPQPAPTCPRCNSPLAPRAQFCPRCGTQLGPQQPSPRNNPGDIADEQTMVVKFPQKGQQAMLMQQPAPQHQTARTPHAVSQNGPAQARHTATATATAPPRTPPVTVMPGGPSSGVTPSSVASSPLFHPKWTVIIGISLILLIILMLVLFFQLMHAHAAAQHVPGPLAANMLLLINCTSIPHLCD